MKDIAIVILNWNGKKYLADFLPSVIKESSEAQIIVADNGSTDDSIEFLKTTFSTVQIIELDKNHGFCGGYNRALKQIDAKYYMILNSDVEVTPNWLIPLYQLLENNENIAACQPKIKSYHQRSHFEHAGAAGGFIDALGYPFCRGRLFEEIEEDKGQYNDTIPIFWATGACLLIRSKIFHTMGGFDEDFFAHMEEIDLCWRIKNAGHQIYYCGNSEVYHVGGGTLPKSNPRKTFLNFRNGLVLLLKNMPRFPFLSVIFSRMVLDGVAIIFFIIAGFSKDAYAVFKAHMSFYRRLGLWFSKRKRNWSLSKNNHKHPEVYVNSIVFQHFVKKVKTYTELNFQKHPLQNKN